MPEVEPIHPTAAAVLMAVGNGATTITEVMEAVNLSKAQSWRWLDVLRDEGWIIWPHDTLGALRPNFGIVADWRKP